jgi:hypothetical protein
MEQVVGKSFVCEVLRWGKMGEGVGRNRWEKASQRKWWMKENLKEEEWAGRGRTKMDRGQCSRQRNQHSTGREKTREEYWGHRVQEEWQGRKSKKNTGTRSWQLCEGGPRSLNVILIDSPNEKEHRVLMYASNHTRPYLHRINDCYQCLTDRNYTALYTYHSVRHKDAKRWMSRPPLYRWTKLKIRSVIMSYCA